MVLYIDEEHHLTSINGDSSFARSYMGMSANRCAVNTDTAALDPDWGTDDAWVAASKFRKLN